ncbi:MAG: hypothetical protein WB783_05830 [Arenicellales bacterium]|jgi:hypothetical protein
MKPSTLAAGTLRSTLLAALAALLVPGIPGTALGGEPSTSPTTTGQTAAENAAHDSTKQGDTSHGTASQGNTPKENAVVVPYQKRPAPSYRISLTDGRLFFLTSLEETDTGYVLHTLEGEVIKVDKSQVEKIVKLEKGE